MTTGEVARACGVSADTIRYYERAGAIDSTNRRLVMWDGLWPPGGLKPAATSAGREILLVQKERPGTRAEGEE